MHWPFIPNGLYAGLTVATASGTAIVEGHDDEAYMAWATAMSHYAVTNNSKGLPTIGFWLVVRLDKEDFSEKIEFHEKIPMMMPIAGTGMLIGIARDRNELDKILDREPDKYVYLTYRVKLQGQNAWRTLLEFMGEHDMLDDDN